MPRRSDSETGGPDGGHLSLWPEEQVTPAHHPITVADIAVDIDAPDLQNSYTYSIPSEFENLVIPGACVHIRFNRREVLGYVTATKTMLPSDPLSGRLSPILGVLAPADGINEEQLNTALWMQRTYLCDLITAIKCMAPTLLGRSIETIFRLSQPELRGYQVSTSAEQAHIVDTLRTLGGEASEAQLESECKLPGFKKSVKGLIVSGAVIQSKTLSHPKVTEKLVTVYALASDADVKLTEFKPGPGQKKVLDLFVDRLQNAVDGDSGALTSAEICTLSGATPASIKSLSDRGLLVAVRRAQRRSR